MKSNDIIQPALRAQSPYQYGPDKREYLKIMQTYETHITQLQVENRDIRNLLLVVLNHTGSLKIAKDEVTKTSRSSVIYTEMDTRDDSIHILVRNPHA